MLIKPSTRSPSIITFLLAIVYKRTLLFQFFRLKWASPFPLLSKLPSCNKIKIFKVISCEKNRMISSSNGLYATNFLTIFLLLLNSLALVLKRKLKWTHLIPHWLTWSHQVGFSMTEMCLPFPHTCPFAVIHKFQYVTLKITLIVEYLNRRLAPSDSPMLLLCSYSEWCWVLQTCFCVGSQLIWEVDNFNWSYWPA